MVHAHLLYSLKILRKQEEDQAVEKTIHPLYFSRFCQTECSNRKNETRSIDENRQEVLFIASSSVQYLFYFHYNKFELLKI